jgi:hypothetical protein
MWAFLSSVFKTVVMMRMCIKVLEEEEKEEEERRRKRETKTKKKRMF